MIKHDSFSIVWHFNQIVYSSHISSLSLSPSLNFVILFTHQFSTDTHYAANIRIVNFINIVFIDTEMKETNYSRNRVENSR